MKYQEIMDSSTCPFCPEGHNGKQIILDQTKASLWLNRAPYVRDHLLIVPTRHCIDLEDLNISELKDIEKLTATAIQLLKKRGHKAYSILVRQGEKSGSTVRHIHYHIIPDLVITNKEHASAKRPIKTENACVKMVNEYQKILGI